MASGKWTIITLAVAGLVGGALVAGRTMRGAPEFATAGRADAPLADSNQFPYDDEDQGSHYAPFDDRDRDGNGTWGPGFPAPYDQPPAYDQGDPGYFAPDYDYDGNRGDPQALQNDPDGDAAIGDDARRAAQAAEDAKAAAQGAL